MGQSKRPLRASCPSTGRGHQKKWKGDGYQVWEAGGRGKGLGWAAAAVHTSACVSKILFSTVYVCAILTKKRRKEIKRHKRPVKTQMRHEDVTHGMVTRANNILFFVLKLLREKILHTVSSEGKKKYRAYVWWWMLTGLTVVVISQYSRPSVSTGNQFPDTHSY